ncbi:hypothetical protein PCE1_003647 [Barthelona sp. PCE]
MFWGIRLLPGREYLYQVPKSSKLRFSVASLVFDEHFERSKDELFANVFLISDNTSFQLCTLTFNSPNCCLTHEFNEDESFKLCVSGTSPVHISGSVIEEGIPRTDIPTKRAIKDIVSAATAEIIAMGAMSSSTSPTPVNIPQSIASSHELVTITVLRNQLSLDAFMINISPFSTLWELEAKIIRQLRKEKYFPTSIRLRAAIKRRNGVIRPLIAIPLETYHCTVMQAGLAKRKFVYLEQTSARYEIPLELNDKERPIFLTVRLYRPRLLCQADDNPSMQLDVSDVIVSSTITLMQFKDYLTSTLVPELLPEETVLVDLYQDNAARLLVNERLTLTEHGLTDGDIIVVERRRKGHCFEGGVPTQSMFNQELNNAVYDILDLQEEECYRVTNCEESDDDSISEESDLFAETTEEEEEDEDEEDEGLQTASSTVSVYIPSTIALETPNFSQFDTQSGYQSDHESSAY